MVVLQLLISKDTISIIVNPVFLFDVQLFIILYFRKGCLASGKCDHPAHETNKKRFSGLLVYFYHSLEKSFHKAVSTSAVTSFLRMLIIYSLYELIIIPFDYGDIV